MKKLGKKGSWLLVVVWMVVIFIMSAQSAEISNGMSKGISDSIVLFLGNVLSIKLLEDINFYVRKFSHFIEYMVLGVLVLRGLKRTFYKSFLFKNVVFMNSVYAFLFCAFYAITDEIHQMFVPGRSCLFKDVIIDSVGALVGILLVYMYNYIIKISHRNHIRVEK